MVPLLPVTRRARAKAACSCNCLTTTLLGLLGTILFVPLFLHQRQHREDSVREIISNSDAFLVGSEFPWLLETDSLRDSHLAELQCKHERWTGEADAEPPKLAWGAHGRCKQNPKACYPYPRAPPPGFNCWLRFAAERRCELVRYDRIEQDLLPFRGGRGKSLLKRASSTAAARIARSAVKQAAQMPHMAVLRVKNGGATVVPGTNAGMGDKYVEMMRPFVAALPDMDVVINDRDEPRVWLGSGNLTNRLSFPCKDAAPEKRLSRHLHGYFLRDASQAADTVELLPIFSQAKIDGCHGDITIPSSYNFHLQPAEDQVPWSGKNASVAFWRGATSSGLVSEGTDYSSMHRQRLVALSRAQNKSANFLDAGFTQYTQCAAYLCEEMRERYGSVPRVPEGRLWDYKFLVDVDGNSFSQRLPKYLSSGSLVLRAALFSNWFEERIRPFEHFLPVRFDYGDLGSQVEWARGHDEAAREIAERATALARDGMRDEDIQCYLYRLLLEYGSLLRT